jgi:hypothetical protein
MASTTIQRLITLVGIVASLSAMAIAWRVGGRSSLDLGLALDAMESAAGPTIVMAELFTSEGCSSCPPADGVLSSLSEHPVGQPTVLVLGEHVDYWDHLGWKDPYSAAMFSNRQSLYDARVFHTGSIYTPQLVIDGRYQVIGSDVDAVKRAIARASRSPKAGLDVTSSLDRPDELRVRVRVRVPPELSLGGDADLLVAVAEDHLTDIVTRGENRGRTLAHSAVVRNFSVAGSLAPSDRSLDVTTTVPFGSRWNAEQVRVVAFLQERQSRRIVGAGETRIVGAEAKAATSTS